MLKRKYFPLRWLWIGLWVALSLQRLEAAEDPTGIQKKLSHTQSILSELKQTLFSKKKLETQQHDRLVEISHEMKIKDNALRETQQKVKKQEEKLLHLEEMQKHLSAELAKQQNSLAEQLKMLYALKQNNELKLFLNLESPQDLDRLLNYYPYLKAYSIHCIQDSSENLAVLSKNKSLIIEEKNALAQLIQEHEKQISEAKLLKSQQETLLQNTQDQRRETEKQLALMQAEEKNLVKHLKKLDKTLSQSASMLLSSSTLANLSASNVFLRSKGHLSFPISGPRAEAIKASLPSTSAGNPVMIITNPGQEVRAIHHGRVIFAESLRGFGLLIILDHGAGYMSLYGHNQELYKKVGDSVQTGQLLGRTKTSELGNSSLYFEIRKNGKPINLVGWFK